MDITSASSSSRESARISSNASHPSTGESQVTSPMDYSTSHPQGITSAASAVPIVQSSLADTSFQPSALVFRSGIAFDYDNFPRILSVCWPVFNIESGMSLIARDGPERSLTQIPTNETMTFNNDTPLSGAPVFTWGPPHSVPVFKDPAISTPEKNAPMGMTIRDSSEIQNKTIISNMDECVKPLSERQEEATTTSMEVEISGHGEKHFQESSFDKIQFHANKKRSDSEEATISKDLRQKHTRTKQVQAKLCLSADNKQSGFKTQEMLGPANFESETESDHECHCIPPKKRSHVEDCEHDTVATSKESKISSSSAETRDNSDCKATAEVSPLHVSFNLRAVGDAPIVKEDSVVSAASETDYSEESQVFCSSPPRQSDSDGNHSKVNLQQCSRLEKEHKQENVRDLIARIKYIKSRLDRAESDYRKKRMLRAIIGLQKRVKVLVKGLNKEKMDTGKEQQETSSYNEGLPGQQLADSTVLGSQETSTTGRELPISHVITDQGDASLRLDAKRASKDSSKRNTGGETQQSCKEINVVSPPAIIVSHDNDVTCSETKTADELKLTTFRHSKDGDKKCKNHNDNGYKSNRREDRGSLSLITSYGSVDELSLRLPFGIGLDCSPCGKRDAPSSDLDENDFQKDRSFKAKKMKKVSLWDEDVKKIDVRFQDVTHHIQSVTQGGAVDGSVLNERDEGMSNVKSDEATASRNDECDLLIRRKFSLRDTESVTVFNSTNAAKGISAVDKRRAPSLKSTIDDDEQGEEHNRKANSKDRSAEWDGTNIMDVTATTFNCRDNKSNGDVEMIEIHEHNSSSEEMQDVTFHFTPGEDNSIVEEENHCRSLLERVVQEEETGFTSPAIHNPSGRQEDIDLTQSLQIREARIFNLTRKRDRLLNLTGFK